MAGERSRLLERSALALCLGALVSLAGREVPPPPPERDSVEAACDCMSTVAQMECLKELAEDADRELSALWSRLLASIADDGRKSAMTTAQENWVQFKRADCAAYGWYDGGRPIRNVMDIATCRARHALDRIRSVQEYFSPDAQFRPPLIRQLLQSARCVDRAQVPD